MTYAQHFNPIKTPQAEQADPRQVQNSDGAYTFVVDRWRRLERFLILGSEGGSFYATEKKLTVDNAKSIQECCAEDGERTVRTITEISESGRAPKNDPAVFALALAASHTNPVARTAAYAALPRVCRIGTHLFQFAEAVNQFRGWGRGLRRAVASWYTSRPPSALAYQVAKYGERNGWNHKMLLQLAHPRSTDHRAIFDHVVYGALGSQPEHAKRKFTSASPDPFLLAAHELKHADERRTLALIEEYGFTHEMIADEHRNSPKVWEALLAKMPITAMIRNLGKMTQVGLIAPLADANKIIIERAQDMEILKKGRVHPISMLSALMTYRQGHGDKGSLTWTPDQQVIDALDSGFYASFGTIEPSGKATLLALDVSDSMTWPSSRIQGMALTAREASAAMAMVTARTEPKWAVMGFSNRLVDIPISPRMRLDDVLAAIRQVSAGSTNCALPMLQAQEAKINVDLFVVYTDNETNTGYCHPHQALVGYRAARGKNAKLAVCACVSNEFTIADPSDAGMLDLVGFSSSTPQALAEFARMQ